MNIDYSKDPNRVRKWNIRVTQLPCHSPRLAPPGCLQYFEQYSGIVKSFNYRPQGVNETSYPLGLRYNNRNIYTSHYASEQSTYRFHLGWGSCTGLLSCKAIRDIWAVHVFAQFTSKVADCISYFLSLFRICISICMFRYAICFKRGPDSCRVFFRKAGPFGLGEAPEPHYNPSEIDTECYSKNATTGAIKVKAYLQIDNVRHCGRNFADEYKTGTNVSNSEHQCWKICRKHCMEYSIRTMQGSISDYRPAICADIDCQ